MKSNEAESKDELEVISTQEKPPDIKERTFAFALEIIKFAQSFIDFRNEALRTLGRQHHWRNHRKYKKQPTSPIDFTFYFELFLGIPWPIYYSP